MWERVNVSACECCVFVWAYQGEGENRVVNVLMYCGWGVVYMSVGASFLHVVQGVRGIARIGIKIFFPYF